METINKLNRKKRKRVISYTHGKTKKTYGIRDGTGLDHSEIESIRMLTFSSLL